MDVSMDGNTYRSIMRHQAGAVALITTGALGNRTGLTATAVCSLTDDPPTLLVCVNKSASAHDLIVAQRSFGVNLLGLHQQDLAAAFSGRTGLKGEDRFHVPGFEWTTLKTGAPILTGALASLDCAVTEEQSFSTHTIFIGAVRDGHFNDEAKALLYFRGDFWDLSSLG
ncbi:MAG: flavin reductase family protein [Hyphomicrobiaceae bacterium]|nr:flavin reductase family protein [Hyphomicrobiaceae bacterium]